MLAQNLKDFKILSEGDLVKLSLDRLDAYYAQLDQWEQEKAAVQKKKRDEARLRLVDRKRQEERRLAIEKQTKKLEEDSRKETAEHRVRFDSETGNSSRSATELKRSSAVGKKGDDIDQSRGIDPRMVFSCVEVPVSSRQSENDTSTSLACGPRANFSLPLWKNDGKPLPYIVETEAGVAYPATAKSPKIYYLMERNDSVTSEEVAADKAKASKHPNNPVHKFTVAKDGCIYYNSATWKPSRERCVLCVKAKLHCWRRVASNARKCLRCNYRKAKCEDAAEDVSDSSQDEDDISNVPSPIRKSTRPTKATKRKRAQDGLDDDSDEGEAARRSRGRPKVSREADAASEDHFSAVLSSLKDMIKESARHHAAMERILAETMKKIRS